MTDISQKNLSDNSPDNIYRKGITCSQSLKNKIMYLVNGTKDFNNFSDFTISACRYLIEISSVQEMIKIQMEMIKDISGKETEIIPWYGELVDYKCNKNDDTNVKTLITFPPGLLDQIHTLALQTGLPYTDIIRYALEYYYRQIQQRMDMEKRINDVVMEAREEVLKQQLRHKSTSTPISKNE